MKHLIIAIVTLATAAMFGQDAELTNYRTGIDVIWGVGDGSDKRTAYMEEYLYYDKLLDDHKVVYLKDTTPIAFYHNATNVAKAGGPGAAPIYLVGVNGPDGLPNSGDEGVIRYRWDRDRQIYGKWVPVFLGEDAKLFPAYTAPFTMASQQYGFGDAVNVVGTTGSNGGSASDYAGTYYRGTLDSLGDEWHTLSYADDSRNVAAALSLYVDPVNLADDGKTVLIVVNPKTPCFTARVTGTGQFFTTAPKAYWTPRIVDQTTYISPGASGTVTIELCNIYGTNISYRINGGSTVAVGSATVTLSDSAFSSGSNTLEYWYDSTPSVKRTRTVVKNPTHPSLAEPHGYAAFGSPAKQAYQIALMNNPATVHYAYMNTWRTRGTFSGNDHDDFLANYHTGKRWGSGNGTGYKIMKNAMVSLVNGFSYTKAGELMSFGQITKAMLLDGALQMDTIGIEHDTNSDAVPNRERYYRGYYDNQPVTDAIFAYDLAVANWRSDQVTGGITPIEDYFLRDQFARYAYDGMLWAQGANNFKPPGMWGGSHMLTAGIIACIMPEYSSPLYGTSGVGAASATYANCPFPDVQYTWAQVLLGPLAHGVFPNLVYGTGISDNDANDDSLITFPGQVISGFTMPDGSWRDKMDYLTKGQMSAPLQQWAAVIRRLAPAYQNTRLFQLLENGADGTLIGGKVASGTIADQTGYQKVWFYLCNDEWPSIAAGCTAYSQAAPSTDKEAADDQLVDGINIGMYDPAYYGGADVTAPTVYSQTIPSGGTTIVFTFSEPVRYGAGGNGGFALTLSGGAVTAAYLSGDSSSTLTYSLSRTVSTGETGTFTYTQPGNGIEDTAGNDLASITSTAITIIGAGDTTPPTVSITTPSGNVTVTSPNYTAMAGPAADNTGVQSVLWSNSRGGSGTATGTTSWTIPTITLLSGDNIITVQSRDAAGNLSTAATRTITYNPPSVGGTETHTNPRNRLGF